MTFWGINHHGENCLYQWRFFPFDLRVMDWVLARFCFACFAKCYIDVFLDIGGILGSRGLSKCIGGYKGQG